MAATPTEHRAKIAEARNVLGEVIARARYAGESTILVNRGREAAVIVSPDFYERAKFDHRFVTTFAEILDGLSPEGMEQLSGLIGRQLFDLLRPGPADD